MPQLAEDFISPLDKKRSIPSSPVHHRRYPRRRLRPDHYIVLSLYIYFVVDASFVAVVEATVVRVCVRQVFVAHRSPSTWSCLSQEAAA